MNRLFRLAWFMVSQKTHRPFAFHAAFLFSFYIFKWGLRLRLICRMILNFCFISSIFKNFLDQSSFKIVVFLCILQNNKVATERWNEGGKLKLYFLLFEVIKVRGIASMRRMRNDINFEAFVGFLVPIFFMTRVSTFLFA